MVGSWLKRRKMTKAQLTALVLVVVALYVFATLGVKELLERWVPW